MVEDITPDIVVGATVGDPRVVDLGVTSEGLVATVTLTVTGLMVNEVALGVAFVVTRTLGVVRMVVACTVVVDVVVGVGPDVTSRVMSLSKTVVAFGTVPDVIVCTRGKEGDDMVVSLVDTCTLSVNGCFVSVIG